MRLVPLFALLLACSPAAPVMRPTPPCACPTPAQPPVVAKTTLDGYWSGMLGQLRVALRVNGGEAIVDSLDQNASFPVEKLTLAGDKVHFEITDVGGSYDGTLAGERIDGTWTQAGQTQPLPLTRGAAPPSPKERAPLDAPIEVSVPAPPSPLRASGATHLAYELRIASFGPSILDRIEVVSGTRTLAAFDRAALIDMTVPHGSVSGPGERRLALQAGHVATVFVWIKLDGAVPAKLDHKITVAAGEVRLVVAGPTVAVGPAPRVFAPPLEGTRWLAGNGPSNATGHRRSLIPLGGRARIAQRFAIDWVKVGDDGATFRGDAAVNANYHAYGQRVLAIGDGKVVAAKDGIGDNTPQHLPADVTLDNIAGNFVILDLGRGTFAMYAHFKPGSVRVKVGDRVKPGQELGLVGNSGNSTEPHLHFQTMDAASPLAAEGIPHAYAAFTVLRDKLPGEPRKNELPARDELVTFP